MFCPLVEVGVELGGRPSAGTGRGCDDLGATLCGVGAECSLSWLCHSRGLDHPARWPETRVATRVVAHAAPSARGHTAALLRDRVGRPGGVCPVAVSPDRPPGLASPLARQYRGHLSARRQCSVAPAAPLRAPAGDAVGWPGHRLCGPAPAPQLY